MQSRFYKNLDKLLEQLIIAEKWKNNQWIEDQLFSHFNEIKEMIEKRTIFSGTDERIGLREVVDLVVICSLYLKNNLDERQIDNLVNSRYTKFLEKLEM